MWARARAARRGWSRVSSGWRQAASSLLATARQEDKGFLGTSRRSETPFLRICLPATADGGGDRGETVAAQQGGELALDPLDQAGALVDERGIELHEARPGADLGVGVGAVGDAADADQRHPPCGAAIHFGQQRGRRREERLAAEAAGLMRMNAAQTGRSRDRRVGDDQPVYA